MVGERGTARPTEQVAQREDVGHPAGDPELDGAVEIRAPVVVQPGEAAAGVARGARLKSSSRSPSALEPAQVRRVTEIEHQVRPPYVSPTLYVATPSVESLWP